MSAVATAQAGIQADWRHVSLGDICSKPQYGWTTKARPESGELKLLRTTDITSGQIDWPRVPFCTELPPDPEKYLVREGDILISRAGSVGVSHLVTFAEPSVFASYLIRFRPGPDVLPKYLAYFLKSPEYWKQIADNTAGIAIPNVNASKLQELRIPLAPLEEQRRIVAEIEKQFSRLDEAVANLKRVKANLRRYVAATLSAAFAGQLVPNEAELSRQHGHSFEPGSELLARLRSTRDSRKTKTVELPPSSLGAPAIEGWVWTTLGECFKVSVGATPSRKEPAYWGGSVPWVSSGEVQFSRITRTKEFITEAGLANSSTQINPAGSVLLGMIGQGRTRGQAAILDIAAANNQNCAAIWVRGTPVPPEFVYYWLVSRYEQTRGEGSGNNQQALNKSLVEAIPLPLPPLVEQHRIVAEVDRRLSLVREVEAQVSANLARAHVARHAMLTKSFGGEASAGSLQESVSM